MTKNSSSTPHNQNSTSTRTNPTDDTKFTTIENPPVFPHIDPQDVQLIQDTISQSGSSACGIMGIDIWILNDADDRLYHFAEGMNWINPVYKTQLMGNINKEDNGDLLLINDARERMDELNRLTDPTCHNFYHPIPQPNGVGLAGNYWQQFGDISGSDSYFRQPLVWRPVNEFTTDKDQIPYERMFAIGKAFGKCTGVPFNVFGDYKGVVLFFAREMAQESIINSPTNTSFVRLAANQIGYTLAMSYEKVKVLKSRKELLLKCCQKMRIALTANEVLGSIPSGGYNRGKSSYTILRSPSGKSSKPSRKELKSFYKMVISMKSFIKKKARNLKSKSIQPPNLNPPPPASFRMSLWSFLGCFIILTSLFVIHIMLKELSNGEFALALPPFGALVVLQFSLTAAPASQPRNSILGFTLSLAIVMINKFIMYHILNMPQWFHASLGTSLAIFLMQKTGVIHPPAGAAAFIFALSPKDIRTDFINIGIFLFADLIAIVLAVIMNNLSDKRQYPMYWKMLPLITTTKKNKKTEHTNGG